MRLNGYNYKRMMKFSEKVNDTPLSELKINGKLLCDKFLDDVRFMGLTNWCIVKMCVMKEFTDEEMFKEGVFNDGVC